MLKVIPVPNNHSRCSSGCVHINEQNVLLLLVILTAKIERKLNVVASINVCSDDTHSGTTQ